LGRLVSKKSLLARRTGGASQRARRSLGSNLPQKEGKLRDEEKNVTAIICLAERATELEGSTPGMLPATNS
jgi:hypothetical protein